MGYTPRSRDRYKLLLALTTGVAAFGTSAATGVATGLAAGVTAEKEEAKRQEQAQAAAQARAAYLRQVQLAPAPRTIVLTETRPQRTVVHTRVVQQVSAPGVAQVGTGGAVSQAPATTAAPPAQSAPQSTSAQSAPAPAAPAPAPPPPPPPAPSSGS